MKDIGYKLLKGLFTLVARLPLSVLYVFSDLLFIIIYFIVRYRRGLMDRNLAACFPEMPEKERTRVRRQFYRNFADYIVETIKLFHISDEEISRRITFENIGLIDRLTSEGKNVAVYFAHCGNWEWAPSMTLHVNPESLKYVDYCQVYRPLRNKLFNRLMLDVRSRFGSYSFSKATVLRDIIKLRREGKLSVTGFMSDQKPSHGDATVVTRFLNRPTAFISGTEHLASKLGMAAIYWDTEKLSRGHYRITCRPLTDNAAEMAPGELTRAYAALLEKTILRNPSIWLWTHNRWKYPVHQSI